ncbi:MAG: hypothetical protein J6H19_04885 [Bacteroidaceae bacterium]|nr:hypothetical protein [Bacteroidaceae bacterium]
MRKLNISLWLLCLCTAMPFGAKAQRTLEYSLAFSKTDFSFQSLNGDTSFITSTDKKPVGNVTVGSGKTVTLKAKKEIELKNSFEVPLGAEFSIDIE